MKMYQAIDEHVCIADFAPSLKPGWYASTAEAFAHLETRNSPAIPDLEAPTKRRGRPPKGK